MRKTSALMLCIVTLSITGFTQNQLTIRSGVVLSKPESNPRFKNQSAKQGFFFGLGYNLKLENTFSFQPEISFVQKGIKQEGGDVFNESTVNYLEVPLLFKVSLLSDKVIAYFNAGPAVSFGLNGEEKGGSIGVVTSVRKIQFGNEIGEYKPIDVSAQLGSGLGYRIGKGSIAADIRYGIGLSDLRHANNQEYKNRALMIGVGMALTL